MDRTRRGGSGVEWSGDALCCASPMVRGTRRGEGAHRNRTWATIKVPAPTGTKSLQRRYHILPTLVVVRVPLCPCLYATCETNETSDTNSKQNSFQRTYQCKTLLVNDSPGGKEVCGQERATTRDRPYDATKLLPRPFVHGRGDPLWPPCSRLFFPSPTKSCKAEGYHCIASLLNDEKQRGEAAWQLY
jgi:hypothetical protein